MTRGFSIPQGLGPAYDRTLGFSGSGAAIDLNLVNQITPRTQAFHDQQFANQLSRLLEGKYPITPMGKDLRNPGSQAFGRRTTMSRFGAGIMGGSSMRLFGEDRLVQDRTRENEMMLWQSRIRAEMERAAIYAQKQQRAQLKDPFATGSSQHVADPFAMAEGGLVGQSTINNSLAPGAVTVNVSNQMQLEEVMRAIQRSEIQQAKRRG